MTTAQVFETSVTVNNNSPIQDYAHPDDQTQPTFEMTSGFKPFTKHWVLLTKVAKPGMNTLIIAATAERNRGGGYSYIWAI